MSRLGQVRVLLAVSVCLVVQLGCGPWGKEKASRSRRGRAMVVLDPGHGGRDAGACSRMGLAEKSVVLDTALQVERLLRERRLRVILTRRKDEYVPVRRRAEFADDHHATLLVSIHANSCDRSDVSGFEIYYAQNGREAESLEAARFIERYLKKTLGSRNRGIRKGRFAVLSGAKCPSVLVEVGYLSNSHEARLLSKRSYREKIAQGIARGIIACTRVRRSAAAFRCHSGSIASLRGLPDGGVARFPPGSCPLGGLLSMGLLGMTSPESAR